MAAPRDSARSAIGCDWTVRVFSFPNPVNEVSARLVAGGVVLQGLATIVLDQLADVARGKLPRRVVSLARAPTAWTSGPQPPGE